MVEGARIGGREPTIAFTSTNKIYGGMENVAVVEGPPATHSALNMLSVWAEFGPFLAELAHTAIPVTFAERVASRRSALLWE